MNNDKNTTQHTETLSTAVISAIKDRAIRPIPRWHFILLNIGMWSSGVAAIVIGAIGVCMTIVVLSNAHWDRLSMIPHPQFVMLRAVPYVWIFLLVIFALLARYCVRRTTRGYAHAPIALLGIVIFTSSIIGYGLYLGGAGSQLTEFIDDRRPPFQGMLIPHYAIWEDPQNGLLRGMIVRTNSEQSIALRDPQGLLWVVDITDAEVHGEVNKEKIVHAIGEKTSSTTFDADAVFVMPPVRSMPGLHWHQKR